MLWNKTTFRVSGHLSVVLFSDKLLCFRIRYQTVFPQNYLFLFYDSLRLFNTGGTLWKNMTSQHRTVISSRFKEFHVVDTITRLGPRDLWFFCSMAFWDRPVSGSQIYQIRASVSCWRIVVLMSGSGTRVGTRTRWNTNACQRILTNSGISGNGIRQSIVITISITMTDF